MTQDAWTVAIYLGVLFLLIFAGRFMDIKRQDRGDYQAWCVIWPFLAALACVAVIFVVFSWPISKLFNWIMGEEK